MPASDRIPCACFHAGVNMNLYEDEDPVGDSHASWPWLFKTVLADLVGKDGFYEKNGVL